MADSGTRGLGFARTSGKDTAAREQELMGQGLDSLRIGQAAGAEKLFRQVLALNPTHYGAHYQLAAALDHQNKRDDARRVWERVLAMAVRYNDSVTIRGARLRLRPTR